MGEDPAKGFTDKYLYCIGKAEYFACLYINLGKDDDPWHTLFKMFRAMNKIGEGELNPGKLDADNSVK